MAPPVLSDQDRVFYTTAWTKDVDDKFIGKLVYEALHGSYSVEGNNNRALQRAIREVNACFGTSFDYMYCYIRYLKLKHRYRVFKWIKSLSSVHHNHFTNNVQCSEDAWAYICQKEKFASVYMIKGEKKFDELKYLFQKEPYSPEYEPAVEVIEISSDHDEEKPEFIDGADKVEVQDVFIRGVENDEFDGTEWWNKLAFDTSSEGDAKSDSEVSAPSALSSTEQLKGKEKINTADTMKVTRRLFSDKGSSTASFSPAKKN